MEFFVKKKSDQYEILHKFILGLKVTGVKVKRVSFLPKFKLRMDSAGENKKFREMLKNSGLSIQVEFTPKDSPEYNGVVEKSFAT